MTAYLRCPCGYQLFTYDIDTIALRLSGLPKLMMSTRFVRGTKAMITTVISLRSLILVLTVNIAYTQTMISRSSESFILSVRGLYSSFVPTAMKYNLSILCSIVT
ncbi:uncharacterized protein BT62DRAFT_1071567 [Guyanagaster necrorhizus]|uniref:Uncharacterized protein n=1 Tax=Guyanagaster necrorhizus TaxID=856835 RepID=A0A9P7W2E6_9AGAR|nr:uncharacterized protein BT62DRAFT_1071567 [Guyanagaster necrorhizus MCA 3950]KAG7450953.1 hypothetical protein BT62DRAFT_1071567 [Guyanagaster necrorhizus MCA 3950]